MDLPMTSGAERLTWRVRHATNIPSIDAYHRALFKILSMLLKASRHGRMGDEVAPILAFLEKHTKAHFEGEEAFMGRMGFPDAPAHLQEHRRFTAQLGRLMERLEQGDPHIGSELTLALSAWLSDHLLKKDRQFAEFIKEEANV